MNDAVSVRDVASRCILTEKARALLHDRMLPRRFVERLLKRELYCDAIHFLSHALPKPLAVWWGCQCAWYMLRPEPPVNQAAALERVVHWVLAPTEENRRAAEGPAMTDNAETPAGCLALAVFCSGGSISLAGLPPVAAPRALTGRLVAGAILLAAVQRDAPRYREHYRMFLEFGLEIAREQPYWTESRPRPPRKNAKEKAPPAKVGMLEGVGY